MIVMSALLLGLIIVTTILTPGWYQPILRPNFGQGLTEVLDGPEKTTGIRLNTTLMDWLRMFGIPNGISKILYGITIVACTVTAARSIWYTNSIMEITVIALLVNFAITPYALQYDFPPMVIPMFWALATSGNAASNKIRILLIGFVTSVLLWENPISDGYWIVIGLSILTVWTKITTQYS